MASEFIIEGIKEIEKMAGNYAGARKMMHDLLIKACSKFSLESLESSKRKYLSGGSSDVLKVVTGRLRSSITPGIKESGEDIIVSLGTGVPYGRIHEYGGPILRRGKVVGRMPERSFLRRAFMDNMEAFGADIMTVVTGAAEGGWKRG